MALIKFEKNIKNKLDERTINPSSSAWVKLPDNFFSQEKSRLRNMIC